MVEDRAMLQALRLNYLSETLADAPRDGKAQKDLKTMQLKIVQWPRKISFRIA